MGVGVVLFLVLIFCKRDRRRSLKSASGNDKKCDHDQ